MEILGLLSLCWGIGITIFWIWIALEVLKALNRMVILQDTIQKRLYQITASLEKKDQA